MRILFVSANSADAYIDIEREHRALQQMIDRTGHTLQALPAAEIGDLRGALQSGSGKDRFDVLHFSGHVTERSELELRGQGRRKDLLGADALRGFLAGTGVKLVVLNACHSADLATILSDVVADAIGTTRKIRDVAARRFTFDFYGALLDGVDLKSAFGIALGQQKQSATPAYVHVENPGDALSRRRMACAIQPGRFRRKSG